jgi:acetyltransferase-like isoleucine patch superfamily enzyme
MYEGLVVGRDVRIGRGATLRVVRGGRMIIGDGSRIEAGCDLVAYGALEIGPRAFVGRGSILVATDRISIGTDALIAAYVTIRDQDHSIGQGQPFNQQDLVMAPVVIGDNVWIGTKASILKGVRVGSNAVIGAHALVNGDVADGAIVGGIPAKVLRNNEAH